MHVENDPLGTPIVPPWHALLAGVNLRKVHDNMTSHTTNLPLLRIDSALFYVQVNIVIKFVLDGSSCTRRRCWFAIHQSHVVQHHSQVFWVGCDLSLVVVQNSLTLEVFVFHTHQIFFEKLA